jgi:hypothetical protein
MAQILTGVFFGLFWICIAKFWGGFENTVFIAFGTILASIIYKK